jgi:hypothetical protein
MSLNFIIKRKQKMYVSQIIKLTVSEIIDSSSIPDYKDGMFLNMNDLEDYERVMDRIDRN